MLKDLDKFVFGDTMIDEGQVRELATGEVRELATGAFLDAKRNAIFIGGTGTGKTHLAIWRGIRHPRAGRAAASTTSSTWPTSSSKRVAPDAAAGSPSAAAL